MRKSTSLLLTSSPQMRKQAHPTLISSSYRNHARFFRWLASQQSRCLQSLSDFTLPHLTASAQLQKAPGNGNNGNILNQRSGCGPRQLVQLAVGFQRLKYYPGERQDKIEGRIGAVASCAHCFRLNFSTGQQERLE
jgi:hypothetical protein